MKIVVGILLSYFLLFVLVSFTGISLSQARLLGKDLAQKIKKVTLLLVESYFLILNENQK
ncbi:hypothetical protein SSUST1_0320 [Streptococcus suis ST1]|nr:hypothetical protein SSUST1_0320 [Streptococcus suis ST1]